MCLLNTRCNSSFGLVFCIVFFPPIFLQLFGVYLQVVRYIQQWKVDKKIRSTWTNLLPLTECPYVYFNACKVEKRHVTKKKKDTGTENSCMMRGFCPLRHGGKLAVPKIYIDCIVFSSRGIKQKRPQLHRSLCQFLLFYDLVILKNEHFYKEKFCSLSCTWKVTI